MSYSIKPQSPLLTEVLKMLNQRRGTWPAIARATDMDYSWIQKLVGGKIQDPGINKIQHLAEYLRNMA